MTKRVVFDFSGQTVLISGATRNLGRQFARSFAEAGAGVAVVGGSNARALEDTIAELEALGVPVAGGLADLADADQINAAVTSVEEKLGPIDILINNAGVRSLRHITELTLADWESTLAMNLRAPFLLAQRVMPGMTARCRGRVVNMAGLNVFWGSENSVHVGASKAGLIGLTTSLAAYGARSGVTVNTVMAGFIDTDLSYLSGEALAIRHKAIDGLVPMGRPATMSEIVDVGLFLASASASYVTGQTIIVSGGAVPMVQQ
ncbi:MAG TPA: SDR family oxidoreductase [Candidatus Acidoferrum sp.]|nr:SDR family oxidoreductase [Candidatus Acidoferrum sp.]